MSTPPRPYSVVFFIASPVVEKGSSISPIELLFHWMLWIHLQNHRDYFFQFVKESNSGRLVPGPQSEREWSEQEKLKMRNECHFVGLTMQTRAEIEEKSEYFISAFGVGI
jgi:hypothetical protein